MAVVQKDFELAGDLRSYVSRERGTGESSRLVLREQRYRVFDSERSDLQLRYAANPSGDLSAGAGALQKRQRATTLTTTQ